MLSDTDDACVTTTLDLCLNILSDNDDACVTFLLSPFLKKKSYRRSPNNGTEGNSDERLLVLLIKREQNLCLSLADHVMACSRLLPLKSL